MTARLDYAMALAGLLVGSEAAPRVSADAITAPIDETPQATVVEIYRGALLEAAEALAGDDADAWHLLLAGFVFLHASRLLELRDGHL